VCAEREEDSATVRVSASANLRETSVRVKHCVLWGYIGLS